MADLPHTGQAEWQAAQSSPWLTQNKMNRTFDAFSVRVTVQSRETSPPGSCNDGDCFFILAAATGDWEDEDGGVAIAAGADASNGWIIVPAESIEREANVIAVVEESIVLRRINGAWVEGLEMFIDTDGAPDNGVVRWDLSQGQFYISEDGGSESGGNSAVIHTDADDYTLLDSHVDYYIRLTAAGTKQIIIQDESVEPLTQYGEWHFRNVSGGDATIVPDSYTVVNLPTDGTLVIPAGATVTLKRVAANEFDLFGLVTAA